MIVQLTCHPFGSLPGGWVPKSETRVLFLLVCYLHYSCLSLSFTSLLTHHTTFSIWRFSRLSLFLNLSHSSNPVTVRKVFIQVVLNFCVVTIMSALVSCFHISGFNICFINLSFALFLKTLFIYYSNWLIYWRLR